MPRPWCRAGGPLGLIARYPICPTIARCIAAGGRMLIVVEGISAAGKTTWCLKHASGFTVSETGPRDDAPDATLNPGAAARFWVEQGERRWRAARAIERLRGVAVCDTDPIKLHYIWSLWQIGVAAERVWQAEHDATRDAIAAGRIS